MPRWRAKEKQAYWHVTSDGSAQQQVDHYDAIDDSRYKSGNYFKSRTVALRAANTWRACLQFIWGHDSAELAIRWMLAARDILDKNKGKE